MHYYISDGVVFRAEDTYNCAWHCGNGYWNTWALSYEVCDSFGDKDKFLRSEQECFKQVAEDMEFYGLTPNRETVRLHQEVFATACPHRSMELHGNDVNKVKDYFISQIKKYMSGDAQEVTEPKPPKNPTYWHSSKIKKVKVEHEIGVYNGKSLSKAKTIAKLKEGQEVKVLNIWKKGNNAGDLSRLYVEYEKGKKGWITGNRFYVSSVYYLDKAYGKANKIKVIKETNVCKDKELSKGKEKVKKGEVFTVVDNVADKNGYPRLKLKSGKYITANKHYVDFV